MIYDQRESEFYLNRVSSSRNMEDLPVMIIKIEVDINTHILDNVNNEEKEM